MKPATSSALRATQTHLLAILQALAADRGQRTGLVPDGHGGLELAWQRYELNGMLAAVNLERAWAGDGPVPAGVIERAEQEASGHCDYASKFAWYCAEIVHDVPPPGTHGGGSR